MFKDMDNNIDYTEYDRITDTLMFLDDNLCLNFSVALSRKTKNGDRYFYHYESMYGSDKYGGKLRSIKRSMNFYFVLDVRNDFNSGIILRPQDVEILKRLIESKIFPWYYGNDQETAFQIIADNLVLTNYQPVIFTQAGLYDTKYIQFEPVVITERDQDCRGVRMILSTGYSCEFSIDKFMGFFHLINSDMYAIAATMCTYTKVAPYGVNSHESTGLGAKPPSSVNNWSGFNSNAFLDNVKSNKREND